MTVLDSLSSEQKAEFLLESNNFSNETLVKQVFTELSEPSRIEDLGSFFDKFIVGAAEVWIDIIFTILTFAKFKNML